MDIGSWPSIINLTSYDDERGDFLKVFRSDSIGKDFKEVSLAFSKTRGILRGLHYLVEPAREDKHVFCMSGEIWDVVVDMRESSPTYLQHEAFHLSSEVKQILMIPPGFAHGYITLTERVQILYAMTEPYDASLERGLRWNDPILNIKWPRKPELISKKDSSWLLLDRR